MKKLRRLGHVLAMVMALPVLMVAAPQFGTMIFIGLRTRKSYVVDTYHSDVVDALMNFDGGAGASATSPTEWRPPEPVVLTDYTIVTGMTDTTKMQIMRSNGPTGDTLRFVLHLTTLAFRPRLAIGFNAGQDVRAIQRA